MLLHFIPDLITALWHCYIVRSSNGEQSPFKPKHKKLLKSEQWGKKIYGCYMDVCLMIPVRHEKNEISKEAEIDFLREWKAVSCWKLELCFLFPFFFFSSQNWEKKLGFKATVWVHTCFCFYVRTTSRCLEPIWCTVAWLQNVSHCSESFSSGLKCDILRWCCMYGSKYICVIVYLYSWIASPLWFMLNISVGLAVYILL